MPAPAMPKVMAMITQPMVSSRIAEATMIWPMSRRMKFISRTTMATIFTELGREDEARVAYERLMSGELEDVPYDFAWLPVVALGASAAESLGDRSRAEKLVSVLTPYRDRYVDVGSSWLGSAAHYLGLLHVCVGDTAAAEACFQDALAAERALGSSLWIARTKLDYARALRGRGRDEDLVRAAELTEEAVDSARSLGLGGVLRRANAAQSEAGTVPRRPPSDAE